MMSMLIRGVFVLCLASCQVATALLAQSDGRRQDTIRVEVEAVNLLVSVHQEKSGIFMRDLSPGDFEIYEDGVLQEITNFAEETNLPLAIALCIDTSSSVRIKLKFEKEAATDFLHSVMKTTDRTLLLEFDTAATLLHDFTSNPNDLTREISRLRAGGGTSLYDAIYLVSQQKMMDVEGRRTLVILSDGADQTSRKTFEDALRAVFQAEAAVYAISTTRFGAEIDHEGDNALKQMAQNTGGRAYFPYSTKDLTKAFRAINEELRNQYSITFNPTNKRADGTFRKLRVRVKRGNTVLHYRKGYFAPLKSSL